MVSPHLPFLRQAIEKAKESLAQGGFPAGAVVVRKGAVIGTGISIGNKLNDPTSHGEMAAIRDACQNIRAADLSGCVLYASMQPCLMCFSASMWAAIPKIVFAARKEKVSVEYYAGDYLISDINSQFIKPIELIHIAELEQESLTVVRDWEHEQTSRGAH